MRKLLFFVSLLLPSIVFAQEHLEDVTQTVASNALLIDQFTLLTPMSINPYTSIFVTALFSKMGYHNDFVATNPFFDNWVILITFGILFLFTSIMRPSLGSNQITGILVKVDEYLESKAAIVINILVILFPVLLSDVPGTEEVVFRASFLTVSLKTLMVVIVSTYALTVLMTIRFFVDTLIYLSPIPLVDTGLQIFKIILSVVLVVIGIVSPTFSFVILLLMLLVSLFFYKKAKIQLNKMKYFLILPVINLFIKKSIKDKNINDLSLPVFLGKQTSKFSKGKIVRLEKENDVFYLVKERFILPKVKEKILLEDFTLIQNRFDIALTDQEKTFEIFINRSYHSLVEEISVALNVPVIQEEEINEVSGNSLLKKVKSLFSKKDLSQMKSMA
ncbi:hypothetical protein [Flammeovirga sp. SJP92]|uniref:hypothetical protein n=1 Tax=Flammeovirga sp. SJP92 TaxID=1775430 RepID=UPI0007890269|nr:hypothetical protein [Flammeovirga sp. SJP92]KXX69027.1 hypothetical protein AVL50_17880 [Flammeovirga sp. SJP92]